MSVFSVNARYREKDRSTSQESQSCHGMKEKFHNLERESNLRLPVLRYLLSTVRSSPIAFIVPFPFLKPNCSSSNCFSILEYKRRFSICRRIFAVCDIRLIVLNSSHFLALFFFGTGSNTAFVKSSGQSPFSYKPTVMSLYFFKYMSRSEQKW
ncbi:hypothetical protein ANN_10461 [Periplaneta americana]|uniref:Transmembrane protein n=1 Tax=Periplaneta americana TaxID=6978 RepID=A0ABQ8TRU7_PERAM|nr:hypothetical protein ANN_10461 [Periplaneta americana]